MELSPEAKEKVRKFIARHHVSIREEVEQDLEDCRTLPPEKSWRLIHAVCRSGMFLLDASPHRVRVLTDREPAHPSYGRILARLREKAHVAIGK